MSGADPSYSDKLTLIRSAQRDVDFAVSKANEAFRWAQEARATLAELERRFFRKHQPEDAA
jgi:hypothetical protein